MCPAGCFKLYLIIYLITYLIICIYKFEIPTPTETVEPAKSAREPDNDTLEILLRVLRMTLIFVYEDMCYNYNQRWLFTGYSDEQVYHVQNFHVQVSPVFSLLPR